VKLAELKARYTPLIREALATQIDSVTVEPLRAAMHHLLGGGKLLRPLLVLASCRAVDGQDPGRHVPLAAAFELIHVFSLIHDDLPALDDAALRRGMPAVHIAHSEPLALLAGAGLLGMAVEVLVSRSDALEPTVRLRIIDVTTQAVQQMIEGELLDLEAEGRSLGLEELRRMQLLKSGASLGACCEVGALLGGADEDLALGFRELGRRLGLAFQLRDDLLDVESTAEALGKTTGGDEAHGKCTWPAMMGADEARGELAGMLAELAAEIRTLPLSEPALLLEIAEWIGGRTS
jgi:geranylgeranyl pyrophosphate synthase